MKGRGEAQWPWGVRGHHGRRGGHAVRRPLWGRWWLWGDEGHLWVLVRPAEDG